MKKRLTHLNARGESHMVDVGHKSPTERRAVATATVSMQTTTKALIEAGNAKKGDVLAVSRIAGIQAAKRTSEWIPLCHAIALSKVSVAFTWQRSTLLIHVEARALDRTGVEMEALVGASAAALTVYDMVKAVDRSVSFSVQLEEKAGGKSGTWTRSAKGQKAG